MIRSLILLFGVCWTPVALAQSEPDPPAADGDAPVEDAPEDPLSPYRTRFDLLAERTIGTASKPVAFNWRRKNVQLAVTGGQLFRLNNFNSLRVGGMARLPTRRTIVELGASYVKTWDSSSSRLLALTPYRQPGLPTRLELDVGVAFPLAEGVVTTAPRIFPAVEMVFNGYADIRYVVHPTAFGEMKPGQVVGAILSPSLTDKEVENLEKHRLDAMQVDRGRYGLLLGFGNDLYFEQGIFVSPRFMLAVPIFAPASRTDLLIWAEFSLALGWAF